MGSMVNLITVKQTIYYMLYFSGKIMQNEAGDNVDMYIPRKWWVRCEALLVWNQGLHWPIRIRYEEASLQLLDWHTIQLELMFDIKFALIYVKSIGWSVVALQATE